LNNFRIKKAVHLLSETSSSIESIAYMVGFNDPKTFSRVFKAVTGISPRDYRKGNDAYSLNVEQKGKNTQ
ncbi:MAG: helix-turn-helix transcriptional regulator, partial [Oscillospiraceae bacterium]|nr:helix-turn-helix transcriptional regulator [Oscillospiraceae bacterium]